MPRRVSILLLAASTACTAGTAPSPPPDDGGDPELESPPDGAPVLADILCVAAGLSLGGSDEAAARRARELADLRDLGVRAVRQHVIWSQVEREQGVFDFTEVDPGIDAILDTGLEVIGVLAYGNGWAAAASGGDDHYPPDDPTTFAAYAAATAAHFAPRITRWEIWNEQNAGYRFWKPNVAGDPIAYGALLHAASDAIHAAQPDALVLYGGLFFHPQVIPGAEAFLGDYFAAYPDGAQRFDALAFHPYPLYPPDVSPETYAGDQIAFADMIARLRALLDARGGAALDLYATELGWPTAQSLTGETQAAYLARGVLWLFAGGVRRACWYTLDDGELGGQDVFPPEDDFGLVTYDDPSVEGAGTRKPAFTALRTLATRLGELAYVRALADLPAHYYGMVLARSDGAVRARALWADRGAGGAVVIPTADGIELHAIDALDRAVETTARDGGVEVTVGEMPIYVLESVADPG